jgi:pre-mRNA-splicing factor ISY1
MVVNVNETASQSKSNAGAQQFTKTKGGKRKAGEQEMETEHTEEAGESKRAKTAQISGDDSDNNGGQAFVHAQAAAAYIPFLSAESLAPPKMPSRQEMESVLLDLRKKALVQEYFGQDGVTA